MALPKKLKYLNLFNDGNSYLGMVSALTGDTSAVEVTLRGRHKEMDFGEYKQGEDTETKITTQCTYFKLTIDGKDVIEVDTVNMVEIVGGVDRVAEHRKNIGL